MFRVIGMDISKGVATCVMLETLPANLQDYSRSKEFVWWHIKPCAKDLEAVAALEPDLIVFEPSGGKYEWAFVNWFRDRSIPCRQVAGRRLAIYRKEKGITKDDHFDGLAIAAYGLEKHQEAGAFIPETTPEIEQLRRLWLQRHSLVKQRGGLTNRLRLQLASEFPEAMDYVTKSEWGREIPGIVLWLTGDRDSRGAKVWENRYTKGTIKRSGRKVELPGTIGVGISDYSQFVAKQLLESEGAIAELEKQIEAILRKPEYAIYVEAMEALNFTTNLKAVWLSRIYPFDKFLENGKERISRRMSNNGKMCTHNQSLAQFKAALGAAIDISRSGSKGGIAPTKTAKNIRRKKASDKVPIGCKFCRTAFWQWSSMRIETSKASGGLAAKLISKRNLLKEDGKNIFQRSGNLHGYTCKLLYRELKKRHLHL